MSNLSNNTTALQEILEAVNNLPDAGGSESEFPTFTIVNNTPYYLVYGALIIEPASSSVVLMTQQFNLLLGVMWTDGYKEEVEEVNVLVSELFDWNEMATITNIETTEYIVPIWNIQHDGGEYFRTHAILDLAVLDCDYLPNSTITITKPAEPISFTLKVKATSPIASTYACNADEGMTWAQWVESDYNGIGVYITGTTVYALYLTTTPVVVVNPDGTRVTPNDVIVAGWTYSTIVG